MSMSTSIAPVLLALLVTLALAPSPSQAGPIEAIVNATQNLGDVISHSTLHDVSKFLMDTFPTTFVASMTVADMPPTDGLAPNTKLDDANRLTSTVTGGRMESTVDTKSLALLENYLYTGILSGDIVRLDLNDPSSAWQSVYRLGTADCEHVFQADKCGFAAAMQFDADNNLVVADSVNGLFQIDILGDGSSTKLSPDEMALKNVASIAIGTDGIIYYSADSTYEYYEILMSLVDGGSGMVLKYDPSTQATTVLIDNLSNACSVEISDDGTFLIASEGGLGKLWKYYLTGDKQDILEEFGLVPGFGGNVRSSGTGSFLVGVDTPILNIDRQLTLSLFNDFILPNQNLRTMVLNFFVSAKTQISNAKDLSTLWFLTMQGDAGAQAVLSLLDQAVVASSSLDELLKTAGSYISAIIQDQVYQLLVISDEMAANVTTSFPGLDALIANSSTVDEFKQNLNADALAQGPVGDLIRSIDAQLNNWLLSDATLAQYYALVEASLNQLLANSADTTQFITLYNTLIQSFLSQTDLFGLLQSSVPAHFGISDVVFNIISPLNEFMDNIIQRSESIQEVVDKVLTMLDYTLADYDRFDQGYGLLMEMDNAGQVTRSWQSPSGNVNNVNEGLTSGSDLFVAAGDNVLQLAYN